MSVVRRWWPALTVVSGLIGVALAFVLASPDTSSVLRVLADLAGSLVLGLGLLRTGLSLSGVARLDTTAIHRWTAIAAATWTVVGVGLLVSVAGDTLGVGVTGLTVHSFGAFVTDISTGQLGVGIVAVTAVIAMSSFVYYRGGTTGSPIPIIVLALVALVAAPITGHMSQQVLGSLFVVIHVVAASTWLGLLAAMALVVKSRGVWAVLLPRYSRIAWWCVWVLLGSGVVNAAVKLGSVDALVNTGYGRVILAKSVALVALVLLARNIRAGWLVHAALHRCSADKSVTRAAVHVCAIALVFGLAAALAVTA